MTNTTSPATLTLADLDLKMVELEALEAQKNTLEAQIEAIKDLFKSKMIEEGSDHIESDVFRASWQVITSNKLDTKALKADRPEVYEAFCKPSKSTRFCLNRKGARKQA